MIVGQPIVSADLFALDISYLHMDLNTEVRLVSSLLSSSNPMNRFTLRDCSSRGTDIIPNILKTRSLASAVTKGQHPTGTGLKVRLVVLHINETFASWLSSFLHFFI